MLCIIHSDESKRWPKVFILGSFQVIEEGSASEDVLLVTPDCYKGFFPRSSFQFPVSEAALISKLTISICVEIPTETKTFASTR